METLHKQKAAKEASITHSEDEVGAEVEKGYSVHIDVGHLLNRTEPEKEKAVNGDSFPDVEKFPPEVKKFMDVFGTKFVQKDAKLSEVEKVKTLLDEKAPQFSELSVGAGNPLSHEERVGYALMDKPMQAMSPEADNYEIPEVKPLDVNLPKRIRVFKEGPDVDSRFKKMPPIKQELFSIKEGIEQSFRQSDKTEGVVELTGMAGRSSDPVYQKHGPIVFVAFLEHYVDRTAENLGRAIGKAEALKAIGELESKNTYSFDGKNTVHLDDMDLKGKEEFEAKYGVSKRKLLEEERLGKLKHSPERFAASVGREMFGYKNLEKYRESDEGLIPIGENYAFKRIMHGKGKHEIAGVDRKLSEVFEGIHGLDETEFRSRFGESKRKVIESMGAKFYREDVPEMYGAYVKDLAELVKKTPESELKASFSGRTYKELLGGETPEVLRSQLAAGVDDYKKAIGEVSSLFMPEQYEAAKRLIDEQDGRFSPQTQYQKDLLARQKVLGELESLKKKKMLKDPKGGGEFMNAYIRANYQRAC